VTIRTKTRKDLAREHRPQNRHQRKCNDWIVVAQLWPMHGVNLGTMLRSAEYCGACFTVPHYPWVPQALHKGYTIKQRPDVHWVRPNALGWLEAQKSKGTRILAVELADEAVPLTRLKPASEKTIMVLGHEQTGIPPEALEYIDECVEIRGTGVGTTLNVSCAGTAVLLRLADLG
jgi:tRNA (guanosine-2'-O-)-methyltransferase